MSWEGVGGAYDHHAGVSVASKMTDSEDPDFSVPGIIVDALNRA